MSGRTLLHSLHAHDITIIVFGFLLSCVNIVFSSSIPQWYILVIANVLVSAAIIALAYRDATKPTPLVSSIHFWYVAPTILLTFKELYFMIYPIHGRDYDDLLIAADRWLFGVDPTVWLASFSHPLVTEILQIAYSSFYFLLILLGYEFFRREKNHVSQYYAFLIIYGFYLSYVGYFMLPAVGPRFTLHAFDALNTELPGLLLTDFLRDFVNLGESIPPGAANAIEHAQRDVFPSGHTMMMLVMIHVAFQYRMRVKWFVLVMGSLLIIGTVYLRYHYVVDLLAGAVFYGLCMWTAPRVFSWWQNKRSA
jgi:membrane-associated phospholipid phosphatase